ncbi:hypothetical protein CIPAW_16G108500 [Carya illinoinensis]|uniref:Uncharacterized protein n=1 Tax=Carya illinoinensis TaxID=32201 RepID=A0A8T1N964_CARIL|nr:hypothetical protein CIPAW_16G108500 [Carya illinoinensis]
MKFLGFQYYIFWNLIIQYPYIWQGNAISTTAMVKGSRNPTRYRVTCKVEKVRPFCKNIQDIHHALYGLPTATDDVEEEEPIRWMRRGIEGGLAEGSIWCIRGVRGSNLHMQRHNQVDGEGRLRESHGEGKMEIKGDLFVCFGFRGQEEGIMLVRYGAELDISAVKTQFTDQRKRR